MNPMIRAAAIAFALACTVALTACGSLEDAAKARDRCAELEGTFSMRSEGPGNYVWSCDLSDPEVKK